MESCYLSQDSNRKCIFFSQLADQPTLVTLKLVPDVYYLIFILLLSIAGGLLFNVLKDFGSNRPKWFLVAVWLAMIQKYVADLQTT